MTRPRSEIREALVSAFIERGAATWRAVLPATGADARSRSEVLLVRRTVENMVQAGELAPCGREKLQGERVWRTMYELVEAAPARDSLDTLQDVARSWATFD